MFILDYFIHLHPLFLGTDDVSKSMHMDFVFVRSWFHSGCFVLLKIKPLNQDFNRSLTVVFIDDWVSKILLLS